jgi:DUF917 family protein
MRELKKQELQDIVVGGGLFGAGGGGSIVEGLEVVEHILTFGPSVKLASVEELRDHDWGAVVCGVGSPKASMTRARTYSPTMALELLEKTEGFKSSFVVPFEVGAGNSVNPMLVAVQRDIPIVDGDPVGRAVPELPMSTFFLNGIPSGTLTLTTEDKISAVIKTEDDYDTARVTRAITAELEGVTASATHALQGKDFKRCLIAGTTELMEQIGSTIREAKQSGADTAECLVDKFEGYIIGKGSVSKVVLETRSGWDFGTVEVEGDLPIRVMFKNENMIAYRGDKLLTVVPDLICSIDAEGTPLTNADITEGMEITYLGFAAMPAFRGPDAFNMFKNILKRLEYDQGFQPIEELNRR